MSFGGAADVTAMLRHAGAPVAVTIDGESFTTSGVLSTRDEEAQFADPGRFAGKVRILKIATGSLPAIPKGTTLTFQGVSYREVKERQIGAAGGLTRLFIVPA